MFQNKKQIGYAKSFFAPSFVVGYLNQADDNTDTYHRLNFGFTLPIWFWTKTAQIKQAKYQYKITEFNEKKLLWQLNLSEMHLKNQASLLQQKNSYYEKDLIPYAGKIQQTTLLRYQAGQLSYFEMLYQIEQYYQSQLEYLNVLYQKKNNEIDFFFDTIN